MDDDTLKNLTSGQLPDDSDANQEQGQQVQEPEKPKPNYTFLTPAEAGYGESETDPDKISGAPRPQPGMTFTPTGGSVSSINHQLNRNPQDKQSDINQEAGTPELQKSDNLSQLPPEQKAS